MMRKPYLLLTCEHGGNKIPRSYRKLFKGRATAALNSHRGWDPGALSIARDLKSRLGAPLYASETSRLLIDLNRTLGKKGSFSEFTIHLSDDEKMKIAERYFHPHRRAVEKRVSEVLKSGRQIIHFALHSFTPVLNGEVRNCEIGLLYDPKRKTEREICRQIKLALTKSDPQLRVRLNYPYHGISDGFPPTLRKQNGPGKYAGIEIEFNQGWLKTKKKDDFNSRLSSIILDSVAITLEQRTRK